MNSIFFGNGHCRWEVKTGGRLSTGRLAPLLSLLRPPSQHPQKTRSLSPYFFSPPICFLWYSCYIRLSCLSRGTFVVLICLCSLAVPPAWHCSTTRLLKACVQNQKWCLCDFFSRYFDKQIFKSVSTYGNGTKTASETNSFESLILWWKKKYILKIFINPLKREKNVFCSSRVQVERPASARPQQQQQQQQQHAPISTYTFL